MLNVQSAAVPPVDGLELWQVVAQALQVELDDAHGRDGADVVVQPQQHVALHGHQHLGAKARQLRHLRWGLTGCSFINALEWARPGATGWLSRACFASILACSIDHRKEGLG